MFDQMFLKIALLLFLQLIFASFTCACNGLQAGGIPQSGVINGNNAQCPAATNGWLLCIFVPSCQRLVYGLQNLGLQKQHYHARQNLLSKLFS